MTVGELRELIQDVDQDLNVALRVELSAPLEGHAYVPLLDSLSVERRDFFLRPTEYRLVLASQPTRPMNLKGI